MNTSKIERSLTLVLFLLISVCVTGYAQESSGVFSAVGSGVGSTREEALEAARLDAVNTLIFSVLKRDAVYRDLFVPEAFKNGWFLSGQVVEDEKRRWSARTEIRVDESLVEALYVGRYSTTVVNLLDAAESALSEAEILMAEAGRLESNADLAGAEIAYGRSEAKADEIMRYLGPVEDAVYFSSLGRRKAPELKALVASLRTSAQEGSARIHAGRKRLAVDRRTAQVMELLDRIDAETSALAAVADALHPPASAPRSYTTDYLQVSRDKGLQAQDAISHRRELIRSALVGLPEELQYPRARASFLLDRLNELDGRLKNSDSVIARELTFRSPPVRTALWILNHEPHDRASLSVVFPLAVAPKDGGSRIFSLSPYFEGRAEGSFALGDGAFWCRTQVRSGRENLLEGSDFTIRQAVEAGFFGKKLMGLGIAWDWLRSDSKGDGRDGILSVALVTGRYGTSDAASTAPMRHPLLITAYSWELPRKGASDPLELFNLGASAVLRPGRSVRLEGDLAGRVRYAGEESPVRRWEGTAGAGFAFRLPVLRPLLWRLRWEGALRAPFEGEDVRFGDAETLGAFRLGLEYTF